MDPARRIAPAVQLGMSTGPGAVTSTDRRTAVTALFDLHYIELVATARLLVGDRETAEDVVMEAFTALHRRWQLLRDPGEAHRYLRSCVLNGARSQLRRRRVRGLREGRALSEPTSPEDVALTGTNHTAIARSIRGLPRRQREVLVLRFYLDLSEAEVAEVLGIGKGSVKQHSARGLAALARALEASR